MNCYQRIWENEPKAEYELRRLVNIITDAISDDIGCSSIETYKSKRNSEEKT
jgi:hypothetical protein